MLSSPLTMRRKKCRFDHLFLQLFKNCLQSLPIYPIATHFLFLGVKNPIINRMFTFDNCCLTSLLSPIFRFLPLKILEIPKKNKHSKFKPRPSANADNQI